MIARLGIAEAQLQPVVVTIQVENVRIAITIGCACGAIHTTARSNWSWAVFYLGSRYFISHNPPAPHTKFILFLLDIM